MSFWERVGEALGYGVAALVLGPPAAIARGERRRIRRSFLTWCAEHAPMELARTHGVTRRAITLKTTLGPLPVHAEVDLFARRARIEATIAPLPRFVAATVVWEGALRVESDTLDAESLAALRERVESGKLGELRARGVEVASERLVVLVIAMTTPEAWRAIGDGIVDLAQWLADRWPASYRA